MHQSKVDARPTGGERRIPAALEAGWMDGSAPQSASAEDYIAAVANGGLGNVKTHELWSVQKSTSGFPKLVHLFLLELMVF